MRSWRASPRLRIEQRVRVKNHKETIRKTVSYLNNPDEQGGFWLPNIQRPFVWSEEQICRLFDSILREYPISTLLVWRTNSPIRRRKFIDNWKASLRLSDFYVPEDARPKNLVLDGQQRLQSLYIALKGSYEGRELYFDVLSGEVAAPDDVKYRFAFRKAESAAFPWVRFKDLALTAKKDPQLAKEITAAAGRGLTDVEAGKVADHVYLVGKTFKTDEVIAYQELDSIDNAELYTEDDVVEVFIRANSGGTKLGKSDLLFSLLSAAWDTADERMDDLLASLRDHGFAFSRDFVLKTCLAVLGHGARYEVDKFRKAGVREEIQERWDELSAAMRDVLDFVRGSTFIQSDKALPTNLVLIPLIYVRFRFPVAWKVAKGRDEYLLRASLGGVFGGASDSMLDALSAKLEQLQGFDLDEVFGVIRNQNRNLMLTEDRLWGMGYGSDGVHLLFNLWYRQFSYTPAYENNLPQVDHVFPQSLLRKVKTLNPKTGKRDLTRYREADRNQLANCMLLSKEENGAGGKWDTPPAGWFAGKDNAYLAKHLIPPDKTLWELDQFEDFIAARKQLIRQKFADLLVAPKGAAAVTA
jgi:hypothetical protein